MVHAEEVRCLGFVTRRAIHSCGVLQDHSFFDRDSDVEGPGTSSGDKDECKKYAHTRFFVIALNTFAGCGKRQRRGAEEVGPIRWPMPGLAI